MIKLKTKTEFPVLDKRGKTIGNYIIRLIVNGISLTATGAYAEGFYYYCNENNEEITLDAFKTPFARANVEMAETHQLPPLQSATHLWSNVLQRTAEFSFIQQQMESGENYGTHAEDWEMDVDYNERMRK